MCTGWPAPACSPCLSPTAHGGRLPAAPPPDGIYSGPGSGPLTSGSGAAAIRCPTRPTPPWCSGQGLVTLAVQFIQFMGVSLSWSIWTDRRSLQASQLHTVSAGMGALRSGVGIMGNVGTAVVSLSSVGPSWPRFPLLTGMCNRKSWFWGETGGFDTIQIQLHKRGRKRSTRTNCWIRKNYIC